MKWMWNIQVVDGKYFKNTKWIFAVLSHLKYSRVRFSIIAVDLTHPQLCDIILNLGGIGYDNSLVRIIFKLTWTLFYVPTGG